MDTTELLLDAANKHQAGELAAAVALYRQVLAQQPNNPNANHNLAIALMQSGHGPQQALPLFRKAWATDPSHRQHWLSYLKILALVQDFATAQAVMADGKARGFPEVSLEMLTGGGRSPAAQVQKNQPATAAIPGAELHALEQMLRQGEYAPLATRAAALAQGYAEHPAPWRYWGLALHAQQRYADAVTPLQRAQALHPGDHALLAILADCYRALGLLLPAEAAYRQCLSRTPANLGLYLGLSEILIELHRNGEAEQLLRQGIERFHGAPQLYNALGMLLQRECRPDEAVRCFTAALAQSPKDLQAYAALGILYFESGRFAEGEALCRQFLALMPERAEVHNDLAKLLVLQGRLAEAALAFQEALRLHPGHLNALGSWLFCQNYLAHSPSAAMFNAARDFGHYAALRAHPFTSTRREPTPARLRVGLVSGDLYRHPVSYFLESVLAATDRRKIEWTLYKTSDRHDDQTERLRAVADHWVSLLGLSDGDAAKRIHDDEIDVLIDLSGHTAGGRLPVFAWRPAPLQLTWLGYFATTGIAEIDYLLADPIMVTAADHEQFTEKIAYLPTRICFTPPQEAPAVAAAPALHNGYCTFGCFQSLPKINEQVLAIWATILAELPDARLRLHSGTQLDARGRDTLLQRLAHAGIDPERVALHERCARADYLLAYHDVDIILDTFPFPGGTTTCEALWMGVPTLTKHGATMIARQGASILTAAGLPEWIAQDEHAYIEKALAFARDIPALARLRQNLRAQVSTSLLFDAPQFAEKLTELLFTLWRTTPQSRSVP